MISIRQSAASESNPSLRRNPASANETNRAWLKRVGADHGILLLGGASVAHFRVRTAQSHARADLAPSYWSLAGLLTSKDSFLSVPLELGRDASDISLKNGVCACSLDDYDDPRRFPNIAVFYLTEDKKTILEHAVRVSLQRSIIDLPTLMLPWLSYIWIAVKATNPLAESLGLPSAAFLETVYGIAGIDLTPGLASSTSCPEAIWQAAKWWHKFYEDESKAAVAGNAAPHVPKGDYAIRQVAASVAWPPEMTDWTAEPGKVPLRGSRRSSKKR